MRMTRLLLPALLLAGCASAAGDQAEIDGRQAEIVRMNAFVQGAVVPEGRHRVRFVYRPRSFRVGVALSVATLGGLAIALVLRRVRSAPGRRCDTRAERER